MVSNFDVVIIGAGHNGLVAAAYLAKAGKSVLLLEKASHYGGASVSERVFPDFDVKVSKYSYLVSLFPEKIFNDLGIKPVLKQREFASYTPANSRGLLLSNLSEADNKTNFEKFTGNDRDYLGWQQILRYEAIFAEKVWPGLIEPLVTKAEMKTRFVTAEEKAAWEYLCEKPLSALIEDHIEDDYIRGLLFTDAKIGVSTYPDDPSLLQNRTFIYHIIGNGTGEWRVPIGGMGGITDSIYNVAKSAGAKLITNVTVKEITGTGNGRYMIGYYEGNGEHKISADYVLVNAAPWVLKDLRPDFITSQDKHDEGSVFKINMLLSKKPKLKNGVTFEQAFTGTFHIDESYQQMSTNFEIAESGKISDNPSGEMYCQSLTDPSVVSPELQKAGYHTLTLFGLDMPYSLFVGDNEGKKLQVLEKYLAAINQFLETPIEDCLAKDKRGNLCLQAKSPVELEKEVGLPLGNIFHNQLSWPYAEDETQAGSWGVETNLHNIFICGAGAMRGGCVSGIPGHNAAMKILAK